MIISEKYAEKIIYEMKDIINCDINFMDNNGIIIASTDANRKGSYHEGAKLAAKGHKDFVVDYDNQYVGTKQGINMPVYFEREIAGVIGITGEKNNVEKYGKIIKKMTEILIKEAYLKDLDIRKLEQHRALIEDLLFNDKYLKNPHLINKTNLFKINAVGSKAVVISRVLYDDSVTDDIKDEVFRIYHKEITEISNNLIMQSRDFNIMIIEFENLKDMTLLLNKISCKIKEKYKIDSKFGIGNIVEDINHIKFSYLNAKIALDVASQSDDETIIFYDDMDIELILNPIPKEMAKKFVKKALNGLSYSKTVEFNILFKSYEKNNGSINKIADDLYMHKNTIQYKLNSFAKELGYDMRNYSDFTILKIAITLKNLNC